MEFATGYGRWGTSTPEQEEMSRVVSQRSQETGDDSPI